MPDAEYDKTNTFFGDVFWQARLMAFDTTTSAMRKSSKRPYLSPMRLYLRDKMQNPNPSFPQLEEAIAPLPNRVPPVNVYEAVHEYEVRRWCDSHYPGQYSWGNREVRENARYTLYEQKMNPKRKRTKFSADHMDCAVDDAGLVRYDFVTNSIFFDRTIEKMKREEPSYGLRQPTAADNQKLRNSLANIQSLAEAGLTSVDAACEWALDPDDDPDKDELVYNLQGKLGEIKYAAARIRSQDASNCSPSGPKRSAKPKRCFLTGDLRLLSKDS
jgi:hypothetical protein